MTKIFRIFFFLFFLVQLLLFTPDVCENVSALAFAKMSSPSPQTEKKPKYDYMSTILSRSTRPLGLKENVALNQFLNQPGIKWAIRVGERHILQ